MIIPQIDGWSQSAGVLFEAHSALKAMKPVFVIKKGSEYGGAVSDCQIDRTVTARKCHTCEECGMGIPVGTSHHIQSGIQDGEPYRWRVHSDCAELYWEMNGGNFEYYDATRLGDFGLSEFTHWLLGHPAGAREAYISGS